MSPSSPFILRPIATSLMMVAILFVGIIAYKLLAVSSLPEVEYPTIQVKTFYPGASPDVMASSVTAPLERQLGQMAGLNQMTSTSSHGSSLITLQFVLSMSLDVAEQEVQEAINLAATYLPADLPNPPVYSKVNPADTPIITLGLTSKTLPLPQIEDLADTRLALKLSQLPGVGLVSVSGGQRPAVRIRANPNSLASYGLNLEDLRTTIANANVNIAKGNFDGPQLSYTINSNDQLLTSESYRPIVVTFKNNAPVRISDVAEAVSSTEDINQAAWMNTTPAVILNIQRQPGANVIKVVDRIKKLLPKLRAALPHAINVHVLTDRTITIRASVRDAQFELILAVGLVVMVIFLFLRNLPATIIPSISVPVSIIGTFAAMYLLGFSLNNLTLMALIIATGFVVDDAIVMIENISRYIEKGDPPLEAALKGAKQIGFTIMSLTVSLIAVLIPLLFLGDIVGRLFREFAITLSVTILISAFVSLTLTPMLCSRILYRRDERKESRFAQASAKVQTHIIKQYDKSLRWVLDRQRFVLIIFLVTVIITLLLLYFIPKGFFPVQDTGVIQGISSAPQSISFKTMVERQQALAKVVLQDPAVANISSFVGIDGTNTTLNNGRMLITLKARRQRDNASEVINRLQSKLNDVVGISLFMQPIQDLTLDNRVSRGLYQYSLGSPNAQEVSKWTTLMVEKLRQSPLLRDVESDQQNLGLQTSITIDRDTASQLGITVQMIDDTLYDAFGQRQVSIMFTQLNQYRVVLEVLPKLQLSPAALDNIYINSSTGKPVALSVFTHLSSGVGPLVINRQGQFPVSVISFNLAPNATLGEALQVINQTKQAKDLKNGQIPESIEESFEGSAKIFENSLKNEWFLMLAAIVVVYLVLGVLYESYIHPLTILSTLPSASMGALLALCLTNHDLSVVALIGIILLIGIVMKNAIMMIDFALDLERKNNRPADLAIFDAALLRFRPIVMTTLAAMLAAVPLAFGTGIGAELRHPLGIAILGGLIVSQLLTLYTTPVIYLAFDRLSKKVSELYLIWFGRRPMSNSE